MRMVVICLFLGRGRSTASATCAPGRGLWGFVSRGKYGRAMGNVANINCPVCRGVDITKAWLVGNGYYECNSCGARFKV